MGHKLTSLKIENFKSIISEKFELSEYTPLIGYNNAGKTNIVEAIKWAPRKSCTTDFNNPNNPVVITTKIEGIIRILLEKLNQTHRARIEPFLNEECLTIRRTQLVPNAPSAQIRLEVFNHNAGEGAEPWQPNPAGIKIMQ